MPFFTLFIYPPIHLFSLHLGCTQAPAAILPDVIPHSPSQPWPDDTQQVFSVGWWRQVALWPASDCIPVAEWPHWRISCHLSICLYSACKYEETWGSSMVRGGLSSACPQLYICTSSAPQQQGRSKEGITLPHAACEITPSWRSSQGSLCSMLLQAASLSPSHLTWSQKVGRPGRIVGVPSLHLPI